MTERGEQSACQLEPARFYAESRGGTSLVTHAQQAFSVKHDACVAQS
jgi:hypothetical protein